METDLHNQADRVIENAILRAGLNNIAGNYLSEAYQVHGKVSASQRIGEDIRKTASRLEGQDLIITSK